MDVTEAIKKRRSVRNYSNKKVEEEKIKALLEAARLAPSARNIQNRRYVVLDEIDDDVVDACNGQKWISSCPALIVGIVDPTVNKWADTDMAIAFEHMVLQAVEIGLGTCWVGAFDQEKVRKLIGAPEDMRIYALLSVGYPETVSSQMVSKKPLDEIWSKSRYAW
jgi:nitroreductase